LAPAFAYMNVLGALCAFDCVFKALRFERAGGLRFHDTDSAGIGVDEPTLLAAGRRYAGRRYAAAATLMGRNFFSAATASPMNRISNTP
jgi:hypothetical protein